MDKRWHIDCFRCNICGISFDRGAKLARLVRDGSLICNDCTYSRGVRNKKKEDLTILTGDQAFCTTCFKCRGCEKEIENLRYCRTSHGFFCMKCYEYRYCKRTEDLGYYGKSLLFVCMECRESRMHRHQRKALGKRMISEQKMPRSPTTALHRIEEELPALPLPGTPVLLKDGWPSD